MSLALKYRPLTLKQLAGNTATKKSLESKLKLPLEQMPRSFLLYGLSGGGKTTIAGIIAKHLKCNPNEISEVNSASFRSIENARELEKTIRYSPMQGDVRVWILNEVHAWLRPVQDAMLDVLEKAPSHCIFILTTTDPQKLITPLRKRCVEYEVLPLTDNEMYDLLVSVVEAEESDVPDDILDKIVVNASGSSRNALQLLEKVIDLDSKEMSSVALKMSDEETTSKELFDALIAKKDWKVVAKIIKSITAESETIRYSMMGLANAMLLGGYGNSKQAALVLECFGEDTYTLGKNGITLFAYRVICG